MKIRLLIHGVACILVIIFSGGITCSLQAQTKSSAFKKTPENFGKKNFESVDSLVNLSISHWPGENFFLLPKQKILQQFGYELFLTEELSSNKAKPKAEFETGEHHVRCEKFGNATLIVSKVTLIGKEYLVSFKHEPTGVLLYAKTRNQNVEGIALEQDLKNARNRWLGKTVYSLRRFIDSFDSASGKITTKKVKIDEPLKVVSVSWGQTPLPPKPIWLSVQTQSAEAGFIPTCVSWVNVPADKKMADKPWSDDVMEKNPRELFSWDDAVWEAVNNHSVISGMSRQQVRLSWGPPKAIARSDKTGEQWRFDNGQTLKFIKDSLAAIE